MTVLPKSRKLEQIEQEEASERALSHADRSRLQAEALDFDKIKGSVTVKPVRVFGEYVAVIPVAVPEETSGGIVVPNTSREKPGIGVVIGLGEVAAEYLHETPENLIGRTVRFSPRNTLPLEDDLQYYEGLKPQLVTMKNMHCLLPQSVSVKVEA